MLKRLLPALGIVALSACATAHHGPMQRITVDSEPKGERSSNWPVAA